MSLNLQSLAVYSVLADILDRCPVTLARMIIRRIRKVSPAITRGFNIDHLNRKQISEISAYCREYHELALLLG